MTETDKSQQSERCWVVVPVKRLADAKSRLAPVLNGKQREVLAYRLLEHTLKVLESLQAQKRIGGFVVISPDKMVQELVQKYRGYSLIEDLTTSTSSDTLNSALSLAAHWCVSRFNVSALLLLPSDLPLLQNEDILALTACLDTPGAKTVSVIAPDFSENGTNILLLMPPSLLNFTYYFGNHSFNRHLRELDKLPGVQVNICRRASLAFDLDRPGDLKALPSSIQVELVPN